MPKSFYIIDGHAQIYRCYYAPFRPLNSPSGEPTKATHVFCAMLFNLIRNRSPDFLAMALDVSDATVFRRDIDPQYKAQRDPPPEDLPPQADRIIQIVEALGIPIFRKQGFEADDLMATIAERLKGEDVCIHLVSKDKDLEQLISDRVVLFDPGKDEILDRERLIETKGYPPELAVEVQSLTGDTVDNVPGVPGIGPKTAAKLIAKYGSAAAVIEHAAELTPKQRQNIEAFAPKLPITRQLVTLRRDVPFDFDLNATAFAGVRVDAVRPIFAQLGFNTLMRQLEEFAPAGGDGPAAGAAVENAPAASTARGQYELIDTVEKLAHLAAQLARVDAFAFDTETTGLNPVDSSIVGISVAWRSGHGAYIPIRAAVGDVVPVDAVLEHLKPLFENPSIRKVGQNVKFDAVVLRQIGIRVAGIAFDNMIASFVLEPLRRSHGMDALAIELLGYTTIPITDLIGKGRNQISLDQVDTSQVCEYAGEDADITWRTYEVLHKHIEASPMRSLFEETEMPLVEVLAEMENNGVAIDVRQLADLGGELRDRILDLRRRIHKLAGYDFNVDSPKQLARVLFEEQGLPAQRQTKTGTSTDADTLERLAADTDHPIPPLMLEYRELTKLLGTYVDTLPRMVCAKTGRIHAGFHQTGAVTGRLSSSDPNLQNIPVRTELGRRIRAAFVAGGPEHALIAADYSQIELRILAHFSKDRGLLKAFSENQDIHAAVAAEVNGVPLDAVTPEQRSAAKAVNFGLIYGQTPFGLARGLGISQTEAKDFIDRYYARYPDIRAFMDRCIADAAKHGFAETILGRRRPIAEINSRNRQQKALGERLAINTVVQGSAADLIKRAMIDIHRWIGGHAPDLTMLIQVHDELVFEAPRENATGYAETIRRMMSTAIPLDVPIVVDVGIGLNWIEAK